MAQTYTYSVGRRKTASAQVRLYDGKWSSTINGKDVGEYISRDDLFETVFSPIKLCKLTDGTHFSVTVEGSWVSAQAWAISHGLSRALAEKDSWNRTILKAAGLLSRDARKVERKKPWLKKARKSPSWSKR